MEAPSEDVVLSVRNLRTSFFTGRGQVAAVRGVASTFAVANVWQLLASPGQANQRWLSHC